MQIFSGLIFSSEIQYLG
jgi:hypothetical protein